MRIVRSALVASVVVLAVGPGSRLVGSDAAADPQEPVDSAPVQPLVAKGRELASKHELAKARASYAAALALVPDDEIALTELGLLEYEAKDFKAAEATTRRALAHATDPSVRGAALYNLGRIQEDAGNQQAAIKSYRESIEARRNPVVLARLATLDPAAKVALDRG